MILTTEQLSAVETTKEFRALLKYMRAIAKAEPESVKEKFELEEGLWRYASQKAIKAIVGHIDALEFALAANREAQPVQVTDGMALDFHRALTDSDIGKDDLEEIKVGLRAALCNVTATPAPAVLDDYFGVLVKKARSAADKAMRKFPQPNYVLNKVAEESGEVIKAVIHYTEGREEWANVEGEIIDNLAMLIRLVVEGDQVIGFTPPDTCRAAMLAQPVSQRYTFNSPEIPDGWKLVPLAPTNKMILAAMGVDGCSSSELKGAYQAMLAAAPEGGNDHDTRR